ncbi:MAG: hypothetical protein VYE08_02245, partial [Candidatus Thermoplasmatota archaeon]|nr:hypothetical protein [Candidatus Thermoplasmatota archaeon]
SLGVRSGRYCCSPAPGVDSTVAGVRAAPMPCGVAGGSVLAPRGVAVVEAIATLVVSDLALRGGYLNG